MDDLKKLGLVFSQPQMVEEYYNRMGRIFLTQAIDKNAGLMLDLSALPTSPLDIKSAVVKWLISVNLTRIQASLEPILDLQLVLKCPVWKIVRPPLRKITLTQEKMFNKPSSGKTINSGSKSKGINRR